MGGKYCIIASELLCESLETDDLTCELLLLPEVESEKTSDLFLQIHHLQTILEINIIFMLAKEKLTLRTKDNDNDNNISNKIFLRL